MRRRFTFLIGSLLAIAFPFVVLSSSVKSQVTSPITITILEHNGVVYSPALQPQQDWLDSFRIPQPPGYVNFSIGNCPHNWDGCMDWTDPASVVIEQSAKGSKSLFAHEIGHVFDYYVVAPYGFRPALAEIMGWAWQTPKSEEWVASAYRDCALNAKPKKKRAKSCPVFQDAYAAWLANPGTLGQHLP